MQVSNTTDKIELVLGANVTTNQLHINASYNQVSATGVTPVKTSITSSNTTAVSIVPSPSSGNQHQLRYCNIFNADSAQATVTIRTNYNSTTRNVISVTLQVNEYLQYTHRTGWKVFDINGSVKVVNGSMFINNNIIPEFSQTANTNSSTLQIASGTSYCYYMGKATNSYKNILATVNVTVAAATITWSEVAIYKGVPSLGTAATLTRCGVVDTSGIFAAGTGTRGVFIPVSSINAGDDLWFVIGNQATTPVTVRANSIADDIGAGFVMSVASRPSTTATLSPTLSTTITPPRINWMGD